MSWFLSFDPATSTFAFCLCQIRLADFRAALPGLRSRASSLGEDVRRARSRMAAGFSAPDMGRVISALASEVSALDLESKQFLRILDGDVRNTCPDRKDSEISTVERIRATVRYVNERVKPAVSAFVPPGEPLTVLVEFQMGANAHSRTVSTVLFTLFAADRVFAVGPSLKNRVALAPEGRFHVFAARYGTSCGAVKAQTLFNFKKAEELFGSSIPEIRPPRLRGHIADSFMQILGHLAFGGSDEEAGARF